MNLKEFRHEFERVKALGWVVSQRRGPTGVGHTLERLIGLKENNIALPDLGSVELKAHRASSSSMITLFTFNRKAWRMKQLDAIRQYGSPDENGRLGLYYTMSKTPNSAGLFLHISTTTVSVRHISGQVIAEWQVVDLAAQFRDKMPALVLVTAHSETRAGVEWFKYTRAQLMTGTTPDIIRDQLDSGHILVDLRLHDKGRAARNHGTGFRAREARLPMVFRNVREL